MKKIDHPVTQEATTISTNKTHANSFFWPILLITIGVLLLLNNLGILPWNIWDSLTRFWPIILILIGLEILLGRSRMTNLIVTSLGIVILFTILFIYIPSLGQHLSQLFSQININSLPLFNR